MKQFRKLYSAFIGLAALTFAASGCSDELDYPHSTVEPGLPTTINVSVSLPEMTPITRADMAEGLDFEVNSLWIGVFKSSGGKIIGSATKSDKQQFSTDHKTIKDITIDTETGSNYIVAVANYVGRPCLDANGNKSTLDAELSNEDLTYEQFQKLSVLFNEKGEITETTPLNALLMCGHYMDQHSGGSYEKPEPVDVKQGTETNPFKLSGSIHLRRLISQIKFNVDYNQNNIEDFQVISYQVHNVPNQSWLYDCERDIEEKNAGDDDDRAISGLESYQSSQPFTQLSPDGKTWSFDWWQFENKREGLDPEEVYEANKEDIDIAYEKYKENNYYAYRELEHKNNGNNSNVYCSLVLSNDPNDKNNNATFVEMKVRMKMKVDEEGNTLAAGKQRIVDATYTIHLGFCDGDGKNKAMDFNSLRNARYTYKVTIDNVENIMLEAKKKGENAPGAEGSITDVTYRYVDLDAHYGLYNLHLNGSELKYDPNDKDGNTGFRFQIQCYDSAKGDFVEIDSDTSFESDGITLKSGIENKYLNWIEIATEPTKDEGTLTKYNPKSVVKLTEFKKMAEAGELGDGYYTIFFNEYVYDGDDWTTYVNKPDRQLWIRVRENRSEDKESSYYEAKYAFSQKSIQTFYGSGSSTALGIEHTNESYGLNLRNSFNRRYNSSKDENGGAIYDGKGSNEDNGRFNTASYIAITSGKTTKDSDLSLEWNYKEIPWSSFVSMDKIQEVNAITNTTYGNGEAAQTIDNKNPVPLPALRTIKGEVDKNYDPDLSGNAKFIEAINACMNRNRDLNGNDVIDAEEIRWYVPTTNQYAQIVLGSRSLTTPLVDFNTIGDLKGDRGNGHSLHNMQLFFYGSNGAVLWSMEGFSTSLWRGEKEGGEPSENPVSAYGKPWQVRCVRNLGTGLTKISSEKDEVALPYSLSGKNKIVVSGFDSKSMRGEKINQMRPHVITNYDYNSVYRAFEFSLEEDYPNINVDKNISKSWADKLTNQNPCSNYGNGWRVPNQMELMIMSVLEIGPNSGDFDISATFSHFNQNGQSYRNLTSFDFSNMYVMFVLNNGNAIVGTQQPDNYSNYRLRCVKDVD